jgi:hypothetical protein
MCLMKVSVAKAERVAAAASGYFRRMEAVGEESSHPIASELAHRSESAKERLRKFTLCASMRKGRP